MDGSASGGPGAGDSAPRFATLTLDRRRFLVLMGSAAAYSILRPHAALAQRIAGDVPLQSWSLPETLPANGIDAARALVGAAILAPSYWNAQPWRFEVEGAELRLTLDAARTLPGCDPDLRFAHLSLGAALENLLIAARAWGQQPSVQYLPWGPAARANSPWIAATVRWKSGEQHRDRLLFSALGERRTNPRVYDGRAITMQSRAQLSAQVPEELRVHWLEDKREITRIAALTAEATLARANDRRAQTERYAYVRMNASEARHRGDGVTPDNLGLGGPLNGFAARALDPRSRFHHWGVESLARDVHDAVRSSGALALLTAPKRQDSSAIVAGQAYERVALTAATLGIAQQPLSAPVESPKHRDTLARAFGAAGEEPLLLVRLGHAHAPEQTPRRGVALVSTWRAS